MAGRAKVPEELERLTKSQRLTVIDEAALGFENTVIARRTLIDHYPQADIAAEIGYRCFAAIQGYLCTPDRRCPNTAYGLAPWIPHGVCFCTQPHTNATQAHTSNHGLSYN